MAKRPLDPRAQELLDAARASMSRRSVLRAGAVGAAGLAGASALAACGTPPANQGASNAPTVEDKSDSEKVLNFSNWQLYIDVDDKNTNLRPTLEEFKKQTGVTVNYTEDINDNDSFYAKILPQLRAGQSTGRDLFALTDWMAARLIRQGYVQKVDKANTPNVDKNIIAALKSPGWDPNRDYSAPWQAGLTGIAYNAAKTGEVTSMSELLTRPDLKGRVTVLSEWRDTMGLIMLDQGANPSDFTADQFAAAIAALQAGVDSKQIRRFTGNDYSGDLANGTIYACVAWSGDVVQLQADNPDIKFVQPDAGMMIWADNMLIPNLAEHKKNAEKLMNFYYDPEVAAQLSAYVQYISPVEGTKEAMKKVDPSLVDNQLIFPDADFLANTHLFMGLEEATEKGYASQFENVAGA